MRFPTTLIPMLLFSSSSSSSSSSSTSEKPNASEDRLGSGQSAHGRQSGVPGNGIDQNLGHSNSLHCEKIYFVLRIYFRSIIVKVLARGVQKLQIMNDHVGVTTARCFVFFILGAVLMWVVGGRK